jgi:hypothetical protein
LTHRASEAFREIDRIDAIPYESFSVTVSNIEKTLIGLVYFSESPGNDVLEKLTKIADRRVLAGRYPQAFRLRFRKAMA